MKDAGEMLVSPTFWIGTVLSGLIINLISPYISKRLEKCLAQYSHWVAVANQQREETVNKRVQLLLSDKIQVHLLLYEITIYLIIICAIAIFILIIMVAMMLIVSHGLNSYLNTIVTISSIIMAVSFLFLLKLFADKLAVAHEVLIRWLEKYRELKIKENN